MMLRSFLGQCPPIFLTILLIWFLVPNYAATLSSESKIESRLRRIDFVGAVLLGCGILLSLLPLEIGGTMLPWSHATIRILFTASVLCLLFWVVYEERYATEPILSPRLLMKRNVLVSNAIMFFQAAAQLGMMYTIPMYFQITKRVSTTEAGMYLLPAVGGVTVGGLVGGCWTRRSSRYRLMLALATLSSSACYLLLALRWDAHAKPWELVYTVLGGFGNGLVLSVAFISLTVGIEEQDRASAASSSYLSSMVGTTVGITVTSAVIQTSLRIGLQHVLRNEKHRNRVSIFRAAEK